ncbi:hypothetical protein CVT25_004177 [Psilocybe cyanescens]|uniref:DUF6534 domain-containing protein n=1 Tax=Psilocybe cyanescens TaxID=93625 RepID=A0A409X354_PSICY|nr:hypothetical protein CVT25_004177 [Psilocybe cyanescens]
MSPALTIHSTLGAVLVGFALACGVYGILAAQVFSYFRSYPGDKTIFKCLVSTGRLLPSESCSDRPSTSGCINSLQLTVGAVVGTIVKAYFGVRVWRFSDRTIWITGLIMLLTFGQLGLALAFSAEAFKLPSVFAVHDLQTLGTVSLGVGVVTDIITAGALCLYLNRLRTGLKSSDSLVNNLCSYAINTGVLTSTVSVATLILYNAMATGNLYFVATYFILSKLYAISFMATLNTRRTVRGRGTDKQGDTSNHTNMFALGTRMPSMGPSDLENWDKVDPPFILQQAQAFPPNKYYESSMGKAY